MKKLMLCLLLFSGSAFAQADQAQLARIKKDTGSIQAAVADAVSAVVTGQKAILEGPKGSYLDGYGIVVSVETRIDPEWNPFSGTKTPAEIKTIVASRRKALQEKLDDVLKKALVSDAIPAGDSISVIVYIFNPMNSVPELPSQLIFTAKKPAEAAAGSLAEPVSVIHREF